jgi:hypothetical protein
MLVCLFKLIFINNSQVIFLIINTLFVFEIVSNDFVSSSFFNPRTNLDSIISPNNSNLILPSKHLLYVYQDYWGQALLTPASLVISNDGFCLVGQAGLFLFVELPINQHIDQIISGMCTEVNYSRVAHYNVIRDICLESGTSEYRQQLFDQILLGGNTDTKMHSVLASLAFKVAYRRKFFSLYVL